MDRRGFLKTGMFAVTTAAGTTFLVGCGSDSPSPAGSGGGGGALTSLVYVTPFQHILSHVDCYVAMAQGYFAEQGLEIKPVGGTGTASSVSQVVAGQGTFGKAAFVVTGPLIGDQGAEIVTIGQVDQRSQYSVASLPDKPLTNPSQWQGKSIGVISKGGATELILDAMSVAADLDPTKVKKVVTGADVSSLEFLKRGEVDGFITFIGTETAFKQMKVDLHYLNSDEFAPIPGDSYFVKKADIEKERESIVGFLTALRKAWHFMADPANNDKVLEAMAKLNPVEVQDKAVATAKVLAGVAVAKPDSGDFLSIDVSKWEKGLTIMRDAGIVKDKSRPISDFVTPDLIDAVK